ncbi:hypothetical protein ACM46_13335 [Chryseobacterium angstadtii]|uniref:Uncharacterized protein n=1 Tax=Chryseobacterium angstadtii TaxID=558151 RepID=A0A0J7IFE4_9FLAO|nr:T9SS type A sorting domain-containing protein [Chryseobacterium angstadtii]KMQ65158.1 hypothetical protein ACM46_13335 [Chryseobacterium angstadtii]
MKKIYSFLFVTGLSLFATAQITNPAPYCTAQSMNNYNMWDYINISGTTHSFGNAGTWASTNTYKYYNNVVFPSVAAGSTFTIDLRPFAPNDGEPLYFGIFIDFNNNNVFDADELVMKNNNTINAALPVFGQPISVITKSITIPNTTTAGNHRLRLVRIGNPANFYNYSNTFDAGSCVNTNQFNYTSVYDFDLNVTNNLGVNDLIKDNSSFEIYPNPVNDYLKIKNLQRQSIKKISIYSTSGQIVHPEALKMDGLESINVSALPKGVYFITIETSERQYKNTFIKQ